MTESEASPTSITIRHQPKAARLRDAIIGKSRSSRRFSDERARTHLAFNVIFETPSSRHRAPG